MVSPAALKLRPTTTGLRNTWLTEARLKPVRVMRKRWPLGTSSSGETLVTTGGAVLSASAVGAEASAAPRQAAAAAARRVRRRGIGVSSIRWR